MNVFKFSIDIHKRGFDFKNKDNIRDIIKRKYLLMLDVTESKDDHVKKLWDEIETVYPNINIIFHRDWIISHGSFSKTEYFLVETTKSEQKNSATLEVLVLSQLEDIQDAFNKVFRNIKKTLKWLNVQLTESIAFLYIYSGSDIIVPNVTIRAEISKFESFTQTEMFKIIVYLVLIIVTLYSANNIRLNEIKISDFLTKEAFLALFTAFLFETITAVISKINREKKIHIKSFSRWVKQEEKIFLNKAETHNEDMDTPSYPWGKES